MKKMKRFNQMKKLPPKGDFPNYLLTSFKKALRMTRAESNLASSLQVSPKEPPKTFLNYDELQRINGQLLELERQKAEAIRALRERYRCI